MRKIRSQRSRFFQVIYGTGIIILMAALFLDTGSCCTRLVQGEDLHVIFHGRNEIYHFTL